MTLGTDYSGDTWKWDFKEIIPAICETEYRGSEV